ncbi:MAG: hypothetical protein HRU38_12610 [Saccharospirillaceae bacterium]|nr:hypothetical protein [Pseudomonadales bacterium]NRB79486.1 hypothetical protein [Saccharospirillaceae bacterium]
MSLSTLANNVGYSDEVVSQNKLWLYQINVQIDALDFDLSYEFEKDVIEQVSIAYLAVSRHFYVELDEMRYLDFNIRLIEDYTRFINIQKQEVGRVISRTGYYSLDNGQITVLKTRSNAETFRTLKHETCHRVLHQNTNNRALWLNEGIAENCEFAQYDYVKGKVVINPNNVNHNYVETMLNKDKLIPLKKLLNWTGLEQQFAENSILNQVQSGEFIYYLLKSPESSYWFSDLLQQEGGYLDMQQAQILDRLIALQVEFEQWVKY